MTRKLCMVATFGLVLASGLGGCASVNPVVQKEAAPVSFKVGQGDTRTASLRTIRPYSNSPVVTPDVPRAADVVPVAPSRPVAITPAQPRSFTPATPTPAPRLSPRVPRTDFNAADVDRELYAHMRIGKRYKVFGKFYTPKHQPDYDKTGTASWYGPKFHGKPTASGEAFDMNGLSAAHKTLPLNSLVHVENVETGASLILRVNDRGPFVGDRIIDLSKGAAKQLGLLEHGLKKVRVRYTGPADPNTFGKTVRKPELSAEATPVPVKPVPAKPAPTPAPAPQPETDGFDLDSYTPLRRLPKPEVAPMAAVPAPAQPEVTPPVFDAPATPLTPVAPLTPVTPEADDGPLTLTIKGPIHMASSKTLPGARNIIAATDRR